MTYMQEPSRGSDLQLIECRVSIWHNAIYLIYNNNNGFSQMFIQAIQFNTSIYYHTHEN